MLPFQGVSRLWLLNLESKDGKWVGSTTSGPKVPPAKVEGAKIDKDMLSFTLDLKEAGTFLFEGRMPKDANARILGTMTTRDAEVFPAILEPTTLASLDPFDGVAAADEADRRRRGDRGGAGLPESSTGEEGPTGEAGTGALQKVKAAEPAPTGSAERNVVMQVAEVLGGQEGFAGLALDYAEQAEKALEETDKPVVQKRVLTLLADALDKAGKKEDAKKIRDRSDKISSITARTFPGRKGKSERVVLVELFSCAQQPACVATDLAADALLKTYKPSEVVLLQYHLNAPAPDPLANAESESRAKFYETTRMTPAVFVNGDGKAVPPGGGGVAESQSKYDQFNAALAELLERPTKLKLSAAATRTGNKIEIKTDVADLSETGPDIRLRVVLVEDVVTYTLGTKATKYVQVVRHFPNGAAGTAMKAKSATEKYTVDLDLVRKNIKAYLDKVNEARPFPNKERPLELKKLRVVAFVQNDETGEVLNAVQVDVKGE